MTPEQAWPHVKELDPRAECISPYHCSYINVQLGNDRSYSIPIAIDWPEGVDRWPPVEVEYREPRMPEDYGEECDFSDDAKTWNQRKLQGYDDSGDGMPWLSSGGWWRYARIRVTPETTTEESSAVPTCKESLPATPGCMARGAEVNRSKFEWRDARDGDEGRPAVFESWDGSLFTFGFLRGRQGGRWVCDEGKRWAACWVLAEKEEAK